MAFIHCDNLCIFFRVFKLFVSKSVIKMFVKSAILQLSFIPLFLFPSLLLDWQFWWLYFISYYVLSPTISLLAIGFLLFTCCPTFYNIHFFLDLFTWNVAWNHWYNHWAYDIFLPPLRNQFGTACCQMSEMIVHCALSGFLVVYGINTIPVWVHPSRVEVRSPLTNF